jgi:hypothetical protein
MHKTILSMAAAAALALTIGAHAQTADFATIDADASGEVSFDELTAAGVTVTEEQFAEADTDASGGLDEAELTVATAN